MLKAWINRGDQNDKIIQVLAYAMYETEAKSKPIEAELFL
jgi:hypothetical protein